MRVVSLVPSATEILCEIGATDLLVGRSHECDHPPGLQDLPVLTAQRTAYQPESGVGAAEIDTAVRSQLEGGGSLYTLDTGLLADLRPDLILTQDTCAVCSIDARSVRVVAEHMLHAFGRRPEVLSLNPETLEGVLDDHLRVGDAVKRPEAAREAVASLRERLFEAESFVNPYTDGPVVGFMEWTDPVFVAGHWTVEMIERAGGRHPLNETVVRRPEDGSALGPQRGARVAGKSISVPSEVFAASRPDRLVIAPCGLTLDQAEAEARRLADQPWFAELRAVRSGAVAVIDGSAMFNRPGPRLVDAFSFLVGWLNDRPERIPNDFPWRPFPE